MTASRASVAADPVAVAGWLEVDRLAAENRDLRRRVERTAEYVRGVWPHIHDPNARDALGAILRSLTTPVACGEPEAQR
jgi:hypothetical protein